MGVAYTLRGVTGDPVRYGTANRWRDRPCRMIIVSTGSTEKLPQNGIWGRGDYHPTERQAGRDTYLAALL